MKKPSKSPKRAKTTKLVVRTEFLTREGLFEQIEALRADNSRLRHELLQGENLITPESTEPTPEYLKGLDHWRCYIVWTVGTYANGVKHLDIRGITTSEPHARLWSKLLRAERGWNGDDFERVVIEPRVLNHLYAAKLREFMVNTGLM